MTVRVEFCRLEDADAGVPLPRYMSAGAAGADICANFPAADRAEGIEIAPGGRVLVPAGFAMALPPGFEAQVRPRSGLALKHGVTLANAPGTIDADYRGPVGVILVNLGDAPFRVGHGDRVAQMVIAPVQQADLAEVAALGDTARGTGGFGSTGVA